MTKRQAPYRHSDGSGCWTKNCKLGHRSSMNVAAETGNVNDFLNAVSKSLSTKSPSKPTQKSADKPSWRSQFGSRPTGDYKMQHSAPNGLDGDYAKGAHELAEIFPDDVLRHPDWYVGDIDYTAINILRKIQGNPDAVVTVYRAAPDTASGKINNGDWVSLSKKYAQQHGFHATDPTKDWKVIEARIPAKYVWTEGNDLNEFGVSFPE